MNIIDSSSFERAPLLFQFYWRKRELQGPRNSGFNGFIWTNGFLETFECNVLLFTNERVQGSELLICLDVRELWTHQLKSIARALYPESKNLKGLMIHFLPKIHNQRRLSIYFILHHLEILSFILKKMLTPHYYVECTLDAPLPTY